MFQVDSAWIAYNKPKNPELANEYAGFLMALGLNGHLTKLATLNIHDNLNKVHTQDCLIRVASFKRREVTRRNRVGAFYLNVPFCISVFFFGEFKTSLVHT